MASLLYILMTVVLYSIFFKLYQKFKHPLLNPLFWSISAVIAIILMGSLDHQAYRSGTKLISFFLGPATVVLALPVYRQRMLLKAYWKPIFWGILTSVFVSAISITVLAMLLPIDEQIYISLMPKSITTPIGISLSETIGGVPALTVVSIIITGIAGAMISPFFLKLANITHPIAIGIGIGASSHVVGTTKAIELGEIQGAMSSLSIALAGLLTYFFIPIYMIFLQKCVDFLG